MFLSLNKANYSAKKNGSIFVSRGYAIGIPIFQKSFYELNYVFNNLIKKKNNGSNDSFLKEY